MLLSVFFCIRGVSLLFVRLLVTVTPHSTILFALFEFDIRFFLLLIPVSFIRPFFFLLLSLSLIKDKIMLKVSKSERRKKKKIVERIAKGLTLLFEQKEVEIVAFVHCMPNECRMYWPWITSSASLQHSGTHNCTQTHIRCTAHYVTFNQIDLENVFIDLDVRIKCNFKWNEWVNEYEIHFTLTE